jgi:glycosyltransferase involved in cell wall biosynthesis
METYAVKLSGVLASLCILESKVLPGRPDGRPPALLKLAFFAFASVAWLGRRRADVVHIGDLVLWPLALVARLTRVSPSIAITAYGLDLLYGSRSGFFPRLYGAYLKLGVRFIGRYVRVIAISRHTAALCRDAGFQHVVVIPLGVDEPSATAVTGQPPANFILFAGRLVKRKGAAWFACNVLPLLDQSLRLVVVGKPWDESEVSQLRGRPGVEMRAVVSDEELSTLRREALVVVMPNIQTGGTDVEGFGLTALEAAADGGVLLASGIEGIVDAVVDGTTGFLLPAADAPAWAAKIAEVAQWSTAERELFISRAREAVASRYAWPVVARRTLQAYSATQECPP